MTTEVFPDIPRFLFSEESASSTHFWPTRDILQESVSPLSTSSTFDDEPIFNSMDQLSIKSEAPMYHQRYASNPMMPYQVDPETASLMPMSFTADAEYHGTYSPCLPKIDADQLYIHHQFGGALRHTSPFGSDSAYSGGGSYSSIGSDVYHSTPRSSASSECSFSQQWYSGVSFPAQSSEAAVVGDTITMNQVQQFADDTCDSTEIDAHGEPDEPDYQWFSVPTNAPSPTQSVTDKADAERSQDSWSVAADCGHDDDNDGDDPSYKPHGRKSGALSKPGSARAGRCRPRRQTFVNAAPSKVIKRGKDKKKQPGAARVFPCPLAKYGCTSSFAAKNEWKRHISSQHVRLDMWRCNLCEESTDPSNPNHNDFNRKDLFTQHLRRMHFPISDEKVAECVAFCRVSIRTTPPQSSCIICADEFHGVNSWEERVEHIANKHFEKDKKSGSKSACAVANWRDDPVLERWLLNEGLIDQDAEGGWRMGNGTVRRPQHTFA